MNTSNPKILISACLLGDSVRYDGQHKLIAHPIIEQWSKAGYLIKQCPEVSGGLSIPRPPAEIQDAEASAITVLTNQGEDVTQAFTDGANHTLQLCLQYNIKLAILTEGSPSCGSSLINDGNFSGNKIKGEGLTTRLLRQHQIKVFSHNQLESADLYFKQCILENAF